MPKPRSEETGLGESVTKQVNCAVQRVLGEQNGQVTVNGGQTRKRKYTHFAPEDRAKRAKYAAQCGNIAAFVSQHSDLILREVSQQLQDRKEP